MKQIAFILLLMTSAFKGQAQNFPYLNASTGNPDFFTDKDTNMYMIHGNRIAKLDKNFTPLWAKTYGSMKFRNVLLSKTGSMYFIAGEIPFSTTIAGKLKANGDVAWMRSTSGMPMSVAGSTVAAATLTCNSLFLDSGNSLLLAGTIDGPGNVALVKLDTLGNLLKARTFSVTIPDFFTDMNVSTIHILNESSGVVNLVSIGKPGCFECLATTLNTFSYSDAADTVLSARRSILGHCTKCSSSFRYGFYKSKTRSDVYYLFGYAYIDKNAWNPVGIPDQARLGKFTMSGPLWSRGYRWGAAPATEGRKLDEDEKGNIFTVAGNLNSSSFGYYHSGVVKFDSTGQYNSGWTDYIRNFPSFSPDDRANVIHHDRVFLNVVGGSFPGNPVTTETISPGFSWSCSGSDTLEDMGSWAAPLDSTTIPPQFNVMSMVMATLSPAVTTEGFSLSQNFCILMNVPEQQKSGTGMAYPNPTRDKLFIRNFSPDRMTFGLYNGLGIPLPVKMNNMELDLSDCPPGIYFLRIKTGGSFVTQKIVKE